MLLWQALCLNRPAAVRCCSLCSTEKVVGAPLTHNIYSSPSAPQNRPTYSTLSDGQLVLVDNLMMNSAALSNIMCIMYCFCLTRTYGFALTTASWTVDFFSNFLLRSRSKRMCYCFSAAIMWNACRLLASMSCTFRLMSCMHCVFVVGTRKQKEGKRKIQDI